MSPSPWHGKLTLVYEKNRDETRVSQSYASSPLKIQRPFYPEGRSVCHSVVLHTAGGIVGGDLNTTNILVKENAQVLITTAAATKIYRTNGLSAKQTVDLKIEPQATLEWFPQENIIFNGADYQQDWRVDLAKGAHFFTWEINRFGRTARGEKFSAGIWQSSTEINQEGKPILIDRQRLKATEKSCNSLNALFSEAIIGTFIYIGTPVSAEIMEKIRAILKDSTEEFGVSYTLGFGIICRYRGSSTHSVRAVFTSVWGLLRRSQLQKDLIKPRVWI